MERNITEIKFCLNSEGLQLFKKYKVILSMKPKKTDIDELFKAINNKVNYNYQEGTNKFSITHYGSTLTTIKFFYKNKKKNYVNSYVNHDDYDEFAKEILNSKENLNVTFYFKINFLKYLNKNFSNMIDSTTIFARKPSSEWFGSWDSSCIDYEGKKYYFIGALSNIDEKYRVIEKDVYGDSFYGFVFNEDKKMIAGINGKDVGYNINDYNIINISPFGIPQELKNLIVKEFINILP